MDAHRKIAGSVIQLRCDACESVFPHFRFEGEDDTDTIGLGSLTSGPANELVLAELLPDEWNSLDQGGAGRFEARVRQESGRDDLHFVRLLRTVSASSSGAGISFRDFRKQYRPPDLVFSCPYCTLGESKVIEELAIERFLGSGGRVTVTGALSLG